jgi:uncharacterized OB-fold protein
MSASLHHREALAGGKLEFQQCACGNRWLPPRDFCPQCLGADWRWVQASGRGRLVSWVVYRVAYDESRASGLPYNVAVVELEEGPRLITNMLDHADGRGLKADAEVRYVPGGDKEEPKAQFGLVNEPEAN